MKFYLIIIFSLSQLLSLHSQSTQDQNTQDTKGRKTGFWQEEFFFSNDTTKFISKGHYAKGKKTGAWEYWDLDGNLRMKGKFKKGLENGTWESYDKGAVKKGKMKKGKMNGVWYVFDPAGRPVRGYTYKNGKLINSFNPRWI